MTTTKKEKVKAASKPATPKKVAKKKTVKKKTAKNTVAKKAAPKNSKIQVTPEQHHHMICEAAYYISLERTHETVNPTADWLQAEAAINKICAVKK